MQIEEKAKAQIISSAKALGFDDCRITNASAPDSKDHYQKWLQSGSNGGMAYLERNPEKRMDPSLVLSNVKSIISLSTSYYQSDSHDLAPLGTKPRGVVARYARFSDYHDILAIKLKELTATVTSSVDYESQSLWYVDTGPILERDIAQRAGIGFVGKHTNLISRRLGNWFFISEILTTINLPTDTSEKNRCGKCHQCIDACPTNAITKPFVLDARKCISYLTIELKESIPVELRPLVGNRIFGCDDCLDACPWNRFAQQGQMMSPHADQQLTSIELDEWAQIDPVTFKQKFRGTPFFRTKWKGLIRNICVALGNIGDSANLPTLEKLCSESDPMVAEHAHWAVEQIKRRESENQPQSAD